MQGQAVLHSRNATSLLLETQNPQTITETANSALQAARMHDATDTVSGQAVAWSGLRAHTDRDNVSASRVAG